jgi:hypothetical protein
LLLALVVSNAAFTIQLRLSPQTIGSGPEVLGDNAPHFTQGSNTADWWRYSRINVARVWSPPGIVEDVGDALRSLRRASKEDGEDSGPQLLLAPAARPGDYNGDGVVNLADYTLWRDNDESVSSFHAVPEPQSLLPVLLMLLGGRLGGRVQ